MESGGIPTIIPQQILQLKHIFGVNTSVPKSISLLSSDRIFYIAGYQGVVYNPRQKQKSQSYYPGADGNNQISCVCISFNKKTMALGFKSSERPSILYYELNASAKKKKLQYIGDFSFQSWVSLAFSGGTDTKHLASLTNKNSHGQAILAFWNPERMKCEAQIKISGKEEKDFSQILFNADSQNPVVSVLGEKTFRMFQLKENIQQKLFEVEEIQLQGSAQLNHKYTLRSHHYLTSSPHIAVLADEATLIVDYKGSIIQKIEEIGISLCNWAEGFAICNQNIKFLKFEQGVYKVKGNFELPEKEVEVRSVCSNDDKMLALLSSGVMLQGKVRYENSKDLIRAHLEQVNLHFHSGPIVAMDLCLRKPLIATASKDKTIKIWNYEDRTVETPKSEAQAASSLSLHPSGLHLVVAYSDKLRVLNLQKDGQSLSNFKDINSFKNCSYVKFSNGGQYFAATSGNQLHIFKFFTGENPQGMTFSGHSGKIKSLAWSKEDNIVVTCGLDGVIIAYRVRNQNCGQRLMYSPSSKETRIKGVTYSSVAISYDNTIYALGMISTTGQRLFKQIKLDGTQNPRQLAHNNCSQLAFPSTNRIMFCGTDDKDRASGSIKCYKFPSTAHMQQFQAHDSNGVEKICVTGDDRYLISAGRDGAVMVFQIRDKQARSDKLKEILPVSNQILITKNDLDTLKAQIDNLKQEQTELKSGGGSGPVKDDHVRQLKDKYSSDETQFVQKYKSIEQKKNLMKKKFDEEIRTKKQEFQNGLQQYDSNQAKNVMQQSAKYDELKRAQEEQSKQFQKQIIRYQNENDRELRKLQEDYQQKIKNQKERKKDIIKKIQRLDRQHRETMKQINEQKEEEMDKIKRENAKEVQKLTETSLRAKSQVSITKKKISEKEQEKQQNMEQQRENMEEIKRLESSNQQLERQIQQQTTVIQDRDKQIDKNERKIYQLKKKSQQLQKFKYVLDHKIKELKKDIAPRELQIAKMKAQTNKMDKQLKNLNSLNTALAEFVAVLFKNEEQLKGKIANQRARISYQNNKIRSFKDALYQTTQLIQNEQELIKNATDLKNTFCSQSMTQVKMDSQIEQEYKNQKKYLQKSINMLKKNLQKDSDIHKHENIRIMKENVDLIKQISNLRLDIKSQSIKKSPEEQKKNKNEPTEEMIRNQINQRRRAIDELQEKIASLSRKDDSNN